MLRNRRLPLALAVVAGLGAFGLQATPASAASSSASTGAVAPAQAVAKPTPASPWTKSSARAQARKGDHARQVHPRSYRAYTADTAELRSSLSGGRLVLPAPDGTLVPFTVKESSVMQPALQAAHPDVRTYAGQATADPTTSVRVTTGPLGTSATVRSAQDGETWFVSPAYLGDQSLFLSYSDAALPASERQSLDKDGLTPRPRITSSKASAKRGAATKLAGDVVQHTYRVALVNDPTYASYFTKNGCEGTSASCVLNAKAALVNRLDQIYGTELGIRLVLIDRTDKLNLDTAAKAYGAKGPCGPVACFTKAQVTSCDVDTLDRNRVVLGQLVGAGAYDLGHVTLGNPGGGIAYIGAVGVYYKAGGCTGVSPPIGDFYAVDYVAHEMGHQFGADHTFAGETSSCDGTQNLPTAVEPGSGSSIMAYAGICGDDDLQPHSDPSFSFTSRDQITGDITTPSVCSRADGLGIESQTVNFSRALVKGESIAIRYDGKISRKIVFGGSTTSSQYAYSSSGIAAALKAVVGDTVHVYGYGYDPDLGATSPGAYGFVVVFDGPKLGCTDVAGTLSGKTITTIKGSSGVYGHELDQGGPLRNGGDETATDNSAPTVDAGTDHTIPTRTPFTLTGSATDPDDDALTYTWEQTDYPSDPVALLSQAKTDGPLFRMFGQAARLTDAQDQQYDAPGENEPGAGDNARTFPDMDQVLAGNTNAATGECPDPPATGDVPDATVDCFSEWLPTNAYVGRNGAQNQLNFRLTARDGQTVGGTGFDDVRLTLDRTTGPLLVTSQPSGTSVTAGSTGTVSWSVNGTAKTGLAPTVRILLSTDGGKTFGTDLSGGATANDGSQQVTWPAGVSTSQARIKVEAVGNVFFAVNGASFTIAPGTAAKN